MNELDDILQHYGVKGMKWGVRKATTKVAGSVKTRVREEIASAKRNRQWVKTLNSINKMSKQDLQKTFERALLESQMRTLTKNQKTRSFEDYKTNSEARKDYRNRAKLTDAQLREKVEVLRLRDGIRRQVSSMNDDVRARGKKLIEGAAATNPAAKPLVNYGKQLIDYSTGAYD